jgi:hypothetical protein
MEEAIKEYKIERLNDQFSGTTRTVRRNLLIASCAALVLSINGLKLSGFFGLDLKDLSSATLAIGAISIVAAYELASFIVYATIDHRTWMIKANAVVHKHAAAGLTEVASHTKQTKDQLIFIRGKMTSDADSVVAAIKSQSGVIDGVCAKADEAISRYLRGVEELHSEVKLSNALQLFRLYVVDWGSPLIVGGLCLYKNHLSAWVLLQALMG